MRNARVAPMVEANDTTITPVTTPNRAPPIRVAMAAPGSEKAAIAT